jgi:hypothetical protein
LPVLKRDLLDRLDNNLYLFFDIVNEAMKGFPAHFKILMISGNQPTPPASVVAPRVAVHVVLSPSVNLNEACAFQQRTHPAKSLAKSRKCA